MYVQVCEPPTPKATSKAAAAAAIAAAGDEAVANTFDRLDSAIDAWHLNTVDEDDEFDDEEEEEEEAEPDMTFLTGVGIEEAVARRRRGQPAEEAEAPPAAAPAPERPSWEDVEDPTERLALALGLDPRQLAVHSGKMTADRWAALP